MGTKCRGRITQPGRRETGGVAVMMESAWPALTSALPLGAVSALPKDSTGSPGLLPKSYSPLRREQSSFARSPRVVLQRILVAPVGF